MIETINPADGTVLRDRAEALATLVTSEMGKPLAEARGEVAKSALTADHYADQGAGIPHCFRNRGEGRMTIYWVYGGRDVTRTVTATGETFEHLSDKDRGATPA